MPVAMTVAEIRSKKAATVGEAYQLELMAQVAELNENFKEFFEWHKKNSQLGVSHVNVHNSTITDPGQVTKEIQKAITRTPIAGK